MKSIPLGWAAASGAVTAYWVAVTVLSGDYALVGTDAAGAACAAGAAALAGAGWRPGPEPMDPRRLATLLFALGVLPAAVAVAAGGGTSASLAAALVLAAIAVLSPRPRERAVLLGGGGCVLLAAAVVVQRAAGGRWDLPGEHSLALVLGVAGAALVVAGAALGPTRLWPLSVPALVVAVTAGTRLPEVAGVAGCGALAVVAAVLLTNRPTVALAALAVASASASPTAVLDAAGASTAGPLSSAGPVALLAAAAAVLALVVRHPAGAALGIPAAAALAGAVVPAAPDASAALLVAATAAVAVALARSASRPGAAAPSSSPAPDPDSIPGLALGAWLLLAPGTWGWAGGSLLGTYDRGAAVATAVAGITWATAGARSMRMPAPPPPAAPPPPPAPPPPAAPPPAPPVGAVTTALSGHGSIRHPDLSVPRTSGRGRRRRRPVG